MDENVAKCQWRCGWTLCLRGVIRRAPAGKIVIFSFCKVSFYWAFSFTADGSLSVPELILFLGKWEKSKRERESRETHAVNIILRILLAAEYETSEKIDSLTAKWWMFTQSKENVRGKFPFTVRPHMHHYVISESRDEHIRFSGWFKSKTKQNKI